MNMPIKQTIEGRQVPVKIWTDDIDPQSRAQLANIASLPCVFHHVAAMPDVHLGKGATVGSVIATKGAIIPAAVGVDIGCGMVAQRLSITADQLPDSLGAARSAVERAIPLGPGGSHRGPQIHGNDPLADRFSKLTGKHPNLAKRFRADTMARQLGSLGSGNHFLELCLDEADGVWVMLHSGSRGVGNQIGQHFIEIARREMERHMIRLPDRDLAYLTEGSEHHDDYVEAMLWAQDYAAANRAHMLKLLLKALAEHLPPFTVTREAVNVHHNYATRETHFGEKVWVTRKGATRAGEGELGIIPGSMGARSFIVRGRGNAESFHSCSHGAGRRFSRGEAKRRFNVADLQRETRGIECRKDGGVLDEIPSAYKDIDQVMANQADLVEIVHTLRQVMNVKG
jgi:tRNA-splicing ligase RtcB